MKRKNWIGGLFVAGCILSAAAVFSEAGADPSVPSLSYSLAVGDELTYAFDLEADVSAVVPGAADGGLLDAGSDLAGKVTVSIVEDRGDSWLVRWSIDEIAQAKLSLARQSVIEDVGDARAQLEGRHVFVTLRKDGTVEEIHFSSDDPDLFNGLARLLIAETQVQLVGSSRDEWVEPEQAALGQSEATYTVDAVTADGVQLDKSRGEYSSIHTLPLLDVGKLRQGVDYDADIRFADGVVQSLESEEVVHVTKDDATVLDSSVALEWTLLDVKHGQRMGLASSGLERRQAFGLSELPPAPVAQRNALVAAAGSLTWEGVERHLEAFDKRVSRSEAHADFLFQAQALLRLHPELCKDLGEVFVRDTSTEAARYLALDLLVMAGHEPAQSVLRELLVTDIAESDDATYTRMVQRLVGLEAPDSETAAFALEAYTAASREHDQQGTAFALGAVARQLPRDSVEYRTLHGRLVEEASADNPTRRINALRGLGNTDDVANVGVAELYALSDSPVERGASAQAIRRVEDPRADELLVGFASDDHHQVQDIALRVLSEREPGQETLAEVAEVLADGSVHPNNYWTAIRLLEGMEAGEQRQAAAEQMLSNAPADPRLRGKLRGLL